MFVLVNLRKQLLIILYAFLFFFERWSINNLSKNLNVSKHINYLSKTILNVGVL